MYKIKLLFSVVLLTIMSAGLFAQNSTNSPYTRYGYGKLSDQSFGSQRGMGGIGIGLRNPQMINPLNPASFSGIDSMTFMLDVGIMGQMAWYKEGANKTQKINGNLDYIAMQFPLTKNLGIGLGFEPLSSLGYNYGGVDSLKEMTGFTELIYQGNGGLSKVYGALSYSFSRRLSAGINVGYLFGDVIHQIRTVPYTSSSDNNYTTLWIDSLRSTGLVYEAGLQYMLPAGKNKSWVFGAVFSPKIKMNTTFRSAELRLNSSNAVQDNSKYYSTNDSVFELPETYKLGVTFSEKNKLTVGADATYQRWSSAKYYSKTDILVDRLQLNLGGEYIPDSRSNGFFKRMRYRAGANYSNSYIQIADGKGYKEFGAGFGLGIPMTDRRSFLNLAFDYTAVRPDVKSTVSAGKTVTFVDEQYFRITVSYTFNELWFFKRKVQ